MAQQARTFRVFVSSTFSDLKAERNALQERVFPRLRELAAEHGCRFQAIDLRWGVSEEAALEKHLSFDMCRWTCALNDWRSGMERDKIRQKLGVSKVQWREVSMKLKRLGGMQPLTRSSDEILPHY